MQLPTEMCFAAISELQTNALEKLKQRDRFKESGFASLKIKIVSPNVTPKLLTKEVLLSINGSDMKRIISGNVNVAPER